jgi:hypothetical protein
MGEFHALGSETDQPSSLGLAEGLAVTAVHALRRRGHLRSRAPSRRGHDQEHRPRRRALPVDAGGEPLPDRGTRLERPCGHLGAGQLFGRQHGCQLPQRERVAGGLRVQPPGHCRSRPDSSNGLHQPLCCVTAKPGQIGARKSGRCRRARAHCHHARDRIAVQAAEGEQQCLLAARVQPVQVIAQDQQWAGLCRCGQQPVGSRGHGEAPRDGRVVAEAKRSLQRYGVRPGQRGKVAEHRMQQRVQASEGQPGLCLDPGSTQHPHGAGL